MAEENHHLESISSDDTSVLRVLLHTIKGISPVSSTQFVTLPLEDE